MAKRSLGKMSKRTRKLGRLSRRLTIPKLVQTFEVGERVVVDAKSKYKGMPHPRYRGRHGEVVRVRGKAYVVRIKDGRSIKELIVPSVHLEKQGVSK